VRIATVGEATDRQTHTDAAIGQMMRFWCLASLVIIVVAAAAAAADDDDDGGGGDEGGYKDH